jgi:hypothetical protein
MFISFDLTSFKPMIQISLAQAEANIPAEAKADFEKAKPYQSSIDLVAAFELTVNTSTPGPTSLVVHCTDEAAAQKLETSIQEGIQKIRTPDPTAQANPDNPVAQGMDRYRERLLQLIQPQRTGTTITCLHVDGQTPAQQQLVSAAIIARLGEIKGQLEASKTQATKGKRKKTAQTPTGPGPEGQPAGPEAQPTGPEAQPAAPQGPVGPEGQPVGPDGKPAVPDAQPNR